jgi:hypothetical protein
LKLNDDQRLSNFAFQFNLRRYTKAAKAATLAEHEHEHYVADVDAMLAEFMAGRCRLTPSNPR